MASSFCDQQSTLEQINSRGNSAAAVICKMLDEELRRLDVVGLVALLGTFKSIELSRFLLLHFLKFIIIVEDKVSTTEYIFSYLILECWHYISERIKCLQSSAEVLQDCILWRPTHFTRWPLISDFPYLEVTTCFASRT